MNRVIDTDNFDINDFIIDDEEKSLLEETLEDCIRTWQELGTDPDENPGLLRECATELLANALQPIPCWERIKTAPQLYPNGIHETPAGKVLVHDGYFVMLKGLIEFLPRSLD